MEKADEKRDKSVPLQPTKSISSPKLSDRRVTTARARCEEEKRYQFIVQHRRSCSMTTSERVCGAHADALSQTQRRNWASGQRYEFCAAPASLREEPQQRNSRGAGAAQALGASPPRARHSTQPQPKLEHPLLAQAQRPRASPHPFECKAMVSNTRTNGCEVRKWWANPHSLWRRAKSMIASDGWRV